MTRLTTLLLAAALLVAASCSSSKNGRSSSTTTTPKTPNAAIGTVPATTRWRTAAQGTFDAKPWTIDYARTSNNWHCYSAQGSAAPSAAALSAAQVSGATPQHLGQPTQCLQPGRDPKPPFTAFLAGPEKDQWVLVGGVAPGVGRVSIGFKDRSTTRLNIDPSSRLIEWKGPASLAPQVLHLDGASCALTQSAVTGSTPMCAGVGS
jgi:hypothetical protein